VALQIILTFTFTPTHPQTFYRGLGLCECIWQIFKLALCKCKKYIYTLQQDKRKCEKFGRVNDLHLHWIYTPYIWLLTLTGITLVLTLIVIKSPNNDHCSVYDSGHIITMSKRFSWSNRVFCSSMGQRLCNHMFYFHFINDIRFCYYNIWHFVNFL
jgi:hypothetical protein